MYMHSSHQSEIQINAFICCIFDPERKQNNKRANHMPTWSLYVLCFLRGLLGLSFELVSRRNE